jgi:TetR/AcrR family transcriptional regulator, cholesterol catabolism regulator
MEPKERILLKSNELFNRYGIRSVSMDDIAAQLSMSKKTLYQYFTDKGELVNAVFDLALHSNKGSCVISREKRDNAIHEIFLSFDMMREMIVNMNPSLLFDLQKYHPSAYRKYLSFKNDFLYELIRTNLEQGIEEELYRPEIDIDVMTRFRLHSVMLAFNPEVFANNKLNALYIEEQLIEHFIYGLATPKGQKLIQKYKSQRIKNKLELK